MVIDLVSKFIEETRGHPLNVTVPEAQLLHDFATWVDEQVCPTQRAPDAASGDGIACPICGEKSYCIHRDN